MLINKHVLFYSIINTEWDFNEGWGKLRTLKS